MVERPIKKSDKVAASSAAPEVQEAPAATPREIAKPIKKSEKSSEETSPSSEERTAPRRERGRDRDRDKGRGKSDTKGNRNSEARPSNINPALMRGPKPTKPKPPVLVETQVETTEDSEETTEQE